VIEGNPTESELNDAWEQIYSEFSEVIKDKTADLQFLSIKQATAQRYKIAYQSVLLQHYAVNPTSEAKELLAQEGFRTDQDAETIYSMAIGKLKRMQNDLDYKEKQEVKREHTDFELIISEMERYQGFMFDQDKMTVRHFANIYKRFKDSQHERKN